MILNTYKEKFDNQEKWIYTLIKMIINIVKGW